MIESIAQYGWICEVPQRVENLGLMTGIAGIGYGFLRLAAADIVPSVLAIAPPFPSRGSTLVHPLVFIKRKQNEPQRRRERREKRKSIKRMVF